MSSWLILVVSAIYAYAAAALTTIGAAASSHTHGNITNAGAVGSTANLPLITTTSGVVTTGAFGTGATNFCVGNDARLSDTRTPTDGSVTTAKIVDDAVTYAKIQNVSATDRLLGRSTAGAGNVEEITCTSFGRSLLDDANAAAALTTLGAAASSHTHAASEISDSTDDGRAILTGSNRYACRAWVNFNGTGTVAIRTSQNVSSITDHAVGQYTINFTTAMTDADYCVTGTCGAGDNQNPGVPVAIRPHTQTASALRFATNYVAGTTNTTWDPQVVMVAIFR